MSGHCAVFPTASISSCLLQCWRHYDRKLLPFNLFADPHPLTPVVSIFYENSGGRGCSTLRLRLRLKSFNRNTYGPPPVNVANKRLTVPLSPLNATVTRNTGEGFSVMVNVYLLMSSFASRRFSNGWRNGFVPSGAPLIAWVISLAAVGKSPVFEEIRASARWLIQ